MLPHASPHAHPMRPHSVPCLWSEGKALLGLGYGSDSDEEGGPSKKVSKTAGASQEGGSSKQRGKTAEAPVNGAKAAAPSVVKAEAEDKVKVEGGGKVKAEAGGRAAPPEPTPLPPLPSLEPVEVLRFTKGQRWVRVVWEAGTVHSSCDCNCPLRHPGCTPEAPHPLTPPLVPTATHSIPTPPPIPSPPRSLALCAACGCCEMTTRACPPRWAYRSEGELTYLAKWWGQSVVAMS